MVSGYLFVYPISRFFVNFVWLKYGSIDGLIDVDDVIDVHIVYSTLLYVKRTVSAICT